MFLEIIKQFNWVDIFIVILLFRTCYIAAKNGLSIEFFKFSGTITAVYVCLHYYTVFSDFFLAGFPSLKEKIPLEFLDFLSCTSLAVMSYLIFVILRGIFHRFIKMEAVPNLNRWAGLLLGIGRGVTLVGLIMFLLVISSIGYLRNSVRQSFYGKKFFSVAPALYSSLWNGVASKFMVKEEFNKTITAIQEGFEQKK